jgi:glycosyltransferase involved in cell wall biosynthesis
MKIVQICAFFYPFVGGVETTIMHMSREFVKKGNEVHVFCANWPENKPFEVIDGIKVHRLPWQIMISYTPIIFSLGKYLSKIDADIYHVHLPPPLMPEITRYIARKKRIPFVLSYHNDIVGRDFLTKALAWLYNRLVLGSSLDSANKIIVHTEGYVKRSSCLERYKKKISIIPVGVDLDKFKGKSQREMKVVFVGLLNQMHRYKGLDYLLKAMVKVVKKRPKAKLVVIGKGELKKEYEDLARDIGLGENVKFLGYVPWNRLVKEYQSAKILVLPSTNKQEGFGCVVLEALACGTPVIVSDQVGLADMVKKTGVGKVVPAKDVDVLASKIDWLLGDMAAWRKMNKKAKQVIPRYDWKKISSEVLDVYKSLIM